MLIGRIAVAVVLALAASGQITHSAPAGKTGAQRKSVVVIPRGAVQVKRVVSGTAILIAALPVNINAVAVVVYIDDNEIGRVSERPYRVEWDSTTTADSEHMSKWMAIDDQGREMASGSVMLQVRNHPPNTEAELPSRKVGGANLDRFASYISSKHNVRISHPEEWIVTDQSAALPGGWQEGYWLIFSTEPISDAEIVINLRHRLLNREHSWESFVKYTPYVAEWNKKESGGRIIFSSTAGSQSAKRVVHRAMILQGRHLWMMNCIDTSGEDPARSLDLLRTMVESLASEAM